MAKRCPRCGQTLGSGRPDKIFCSDTCRVAANRAGWTKSPFEHLVRSVQAAVITRDRQQQNVETAISRLDAALPSDQMGRSQALMIINSGRKARGLPPLSALLENSPPQQQTPSKMDAPAISNAGRRARGEPQLAATDFEPTSDKLIKESR